MEIIVLTTARWKTIFAILRHARNIVLYTCICTTTSVDTFYLSALRRRNVRILDHDAALRAAGDGGTGGVGVGRGAEVGTGVGAG